MVFIKKAIAKRKKRKVPVFLSVTDQQVLAALEVLQKKTGGALPSGAEIQGQMKSMGFKELAQPTISQSVARLEKVGKVKRSLLVMA
jgi:hypothetical protein